MSIEISKYKGAIIEVKETLIDGINWEKCYLPDGVIIFPINSAGEILLIKEKRPHESPPYRIKPVSGILEKEKGTPEENAIREMREEVGLNCKNLSEILTLRSNGTVNNTQYFFMAQDLFEDKLPNPDGEETILEKIWMTPQDLFQHYLDQKIKWSISTLGFFKLYFYLKNDQISTR